MTSLSVMGVGKIGGEVAYLASVLGIADEICLYDSNAALAHAQALDILHTGIDLSVSTDPDDISGADIAVFSAGIARTPDIKTRADLLSVNLPAADDCAAFLEGYSGVLITITNPMDANNYYLHRRCSIPRERCIGFGGQLDAARFSGYLGEYGIPGDAWVLGEHGEHQVPLFSTLPGMSRKIYAMKSWERCAGQVWKLSGARAGQYLGRPGISRALYVMWLTIPTPYCRCPVSLMVSMVFPVVLLVFPHG